MANKKEKKVIYMAELDRFGYYLTAVADTQRKAVNAIMRDYTTAYIDRNGTDPKEDESDRSYAEGLTAYEAAQEDIIVREYVLNGPVEWW